MVTWQENSRYQCKVFFVTDNVDKGNLQIEYKPTEEMVADFLTKPLQGKCFERFRLHLMGIQIKNSEGDQK